MNCPKCGGGILGFVGGLQKCVDCSWMGQNPKVPEHIWKASTREYIATLTDEECGSPAGITEVIGMSYLMSDMEPPAPKVLEAFVKQCVQDRKTSVSTGAVLKEDSHG